MTETIDDRFTEALHAQMPLSLHHRIRGLAVDEDRVVTAADWQPDFCGVGGVLHGGYLMAMADGTGATLVFVNLAPGQSTTTVESKTNFFRPVTAGTVTATASFVHRGRTTAVVQTDIVNGDGALVSRTTQTQAIRTPTD